MSISDACFKNQFQWIWKTEWFHAFVFKSTLKSGQNAGKFWGIVIHWNNLTSSWAHKDSWGDSEWANLGKKTCWTNKEIQILVPSLACENSKW